MDVWSDTKLQGELRKIPLENLLKFQLDFQQLILQAQKEDYDNIDIIRR